MVFLSKVLRRHEAHDCQTTDARARQNDACQVEWISI